MVTKKDEIPRTPRDRCLAFLEVRRILTDLWITSTSDYEREEIEQTLVPVRHAIRRVCKDHNLPLD